MTGIEINAATGERRIVQVPDVCDAPVISEEVARLRRKYLDLTRQLCQIVGMEYGGRLANEQYDAALQMGIANPATGIIAVSLVYCRTCLREIEGESWWDNIGDQT